MRFPAVVMAVALLCCGPVHGGRAGTKPRKGLGGRALLGAGPLCSGYLGHICIGDVGDAIPSWGTGTCHGDSHGDSKALALVPA
ncbi:hypothetical protein CFR74_06660 [Novacetimonas hansenii]|nr:hypothetical protein CFR74_06660 [Novacetimonas hansenii]